MTMFIFLEIFSWYNATKTIEIFNQLNGIKHLVRGNHDKKILKSREVQALFAEIVDYKEIYLDNKNIVLSHYPIPWFNGHFYGNIHFYGHVHTTYEWTMVEKVKKDIIEIYKNPCRMFNVGCMMKYMDYTPRTVGEILEECENE